MALSSKDLLGIKGMTADEIKLILDTAATFKDVSERDIKKVPTLRGKTVINLFYEASTRTRTSFELAGKRLSADVINISTSTSSVIKGETLLDTARNIEAMKSDMIIVRHSCSGAPEYLVQTAQELGDQRRRRFPRTSDAGAARYVHDPGKARQARRPDGRDRGRYHAQPGGTVEYLRAHDHGRDGTRLRTADHDPAGHRRLGAQVSYDMDEAVEGADVVMMLRLQLERQTAGLFPGVREYARLYGLNRARLERAAKHALVMHPGPMNRGVEISSDVADSTSVILDQVTNGVAVRMAVMFLLSGGEQKRKRKYLTRMDIGLTG